MAQLSYPKYLTPGFAGQLYDNGPRKVISLSNMMAASFPLGLGVVQGPDDYTCRLPQANVATINWVASPAFVTSNVINLSIQATPAATGVTTTTPISPVTYASSSAATNTAIATAIQTAMGAGWTATATSDTKIVITNSDPTIAINVTGIAVTAGASQTTATVVQTSSDVIIGVTMQEHTVEQNYYTGFVGYAQYATVPVLQMGRIYVPNEAAVTLAEGVYCRAVTQDATHYAGDWAGTNLSGAAIQLSRAKWFISNTVAGIAVMDISFP